MAMKSKNRERKRMGRFHKTRYDNILQHAKARAAKGKMRSCRKCPAALVCNSDRPPDIVWRCERCNERVAAWGDNGHTLDRRVAGVRRCPYTRVLTYLCEACDTARTRKKARGDIY